MLIVYKKIIVCLSKSLKVIFPKTTNEETNFESIRTNIIDNKIVYKLHDTADMITFYKKANLNSYNRFKNKQDYTSLEHLRSDIMPKRIKHTNDHHDLSVYIADEFVFVVYSKDNSKNNKEWIWELLLYDTKLKIWSEYRTTINKDVGGICGFYYLRKCRKIILPVGKSTFSDEVFHNSHDKRRGFNLQGFYVIYLNELVDNKYKCGYKFITSYALQYITDKYADSHSRIVDFITDYTIDVNSGIIYMICKLKRWADDDYKNNVIALEYNLCDQGSTEIFEVNRNRFKIFGIELAIPIIEEASGKNNVLLYLSNKRLRDRGMPKYLPMHISSEFYDFMSNKLFHSEMIFSSHSKPLVRDRHFNRIATVLAKIESLKVAAHIPLREDIITMRNGRNNKLLAVLIMNDVAVVKSEK